MSASNLFPEGTVAAAPLVAPSVDSVSSMYPEGQRFTNNYNIPLIIAAYLAYDDYDYDPDCISATALLKPLRQTILKSRVPPGVELPDIASLVKSRIGSAIHKAVEMVWLNNPKQMLHYLGYPEAVTNRILVNPTQKEIKEDSLCVYVEKRLKRKITVNGIEYTISGKPDFVCDGGVQDTKTSSIITHNLSDKDDDYIMQCSIYRWLNPDIITKDFLQINFMFNDWFPGRAKAAKTPEDYPQTACPKQQLKLLSLEETEAFIIQRLTDYQQLQTVDEPNLPYCSDKELWRKESVMKWWSKEQSFHDGKRCGKTFKASQQKELQAHVANKGGFVKEFKGEIVACRYCPAKTICTQKDQYVEQGLLTFD